MQWVLLLMTTNTLIIRDALGLLGVLNEIETPSAEQGAHGLRVMNEMLEEWNADGIRVGQWPQSDITAQSPIAQSALSAVKYQLAAALGPYYGKQLPGDAVARGERLYGRLVREAAVAAHEEADTSHLPGAGGSWNILTDS